jgi:hypothetical protein
MSMTEERPATKAKGKAKAAAAKAATMHAELVGPEAKELATAVRVVAIAASRDDARPLLTGLLFESFGTVVRLSATDSYRIFSAEFRLSMPECRAVIPAAWFAKVLPRRTSMADRYDLTIDDGLVTWHDKQTSDSSTIKLRRSGSGPDYPNVVELLDNNPMPEADANEGRSAFNAKLLGDIFKAANLWADSSPVRVGHLNPLKPCPFEVVSGLGTLRMLLMPVRVPGWGEPS